MKARPCGFLAVLAVLAVLTCSATPVQAWHGGWGIGIHFPVYVGPYYGCYPCYRPVPVIVEQVPVVVQPVPVAPPVTAVPPAYPAPVYQAPPPPITRASGAPVADAQQAEVQRQVDRLSAVEEDVRSEAALHLGWMRAQAAVDPLAATLAGDRSPKVREAAARALALIGSPKALPALQRAAQADGDHDVRHSAQFAIEVVQSGGR
jgi:HEAT repeats